MVLFMITIIYNLTPNTLSTVSAVEQPYGPKSMKGPPVTVDANATEGTPGVYWYQLDSGEFRADFQGTYKIVDNGGSDDDAYPVKTEIPDNVDMSRWPPLSWKPYKGLTVNNSVVTDIKLKDNPEGVKYKQVNSYEGIGSPRVTSEKNADLRTYTGKGFDFFERERYGTRPGDKPKFKMVYHTPVSIFWEGKIHEEKEIDVTPDSTLTVGETKQMVAKVKTKNYGATQFSEGIDVSRRDAETTWWSSDPSIVSIEPKTGMVKAEKPGTAFVRAIWNNGTYLISDTANITVTSEPGLIVNLPNACKADTATPLQAKAILTKSDLSVHELTAHPKLTWQSSNPAVATIGADGKMTIKGIVGSTTITARFVDTAQQLDEQGTQVLDVKDCTGNGGDGGTDPGNGGVVGCQLTISPPNKGTLIESAAMDPSVRGVLKADDRGSEKFDVTRGIPTSEDLYANVMAKGYLFQHRWVNMTGTVTYTVNVKKNYHKTWTIPGRASTGPNDPGTPPQPKELDVPVEKPMQVIRQYSYWQIDNLEVYQLDQATISNYAIGGYGGTVTLTPNGYTPPTLQSANDDAVTAHVKPAPCKEINLGTETKPGGDSEPPTPDETSLFQSKAEAEVKENTVNNDKVVFNGATVMDPAPMDKTAPRPGTIPQPGMIGDNVLYQNRLTIQNTLVNKADQPTTGEIAYGLIPGNIKGGRDQKFSIQGINSVTVHTPVVNYASVSDDQPHNQKTVPDPTSSALILERPFIVRIPTAGQHLDATSYPGYGNRDYAKYFRIKQIRFPFDVYNADRSQFIPAKTWVDIPVNQLDTVFYLPVWVDEGHYRIEFRNIAENAPSTFTEQQDANTNLTHHVAADTVPVEVIGRLYDFHVTDITDYNWENVFRKQLGSSEPTGMSYWTGLNSIDGDPRGNLAPFVLPVHPGSHPVQGFSNIAVKTGYHIKFDLKTKGNMFGKQDGVRITPTFYFVSKDGSSRQEVDLYYHRGQERLIRIGSAQDLEKRFVVLNSRLRNVPDTELGDTARYQYTYELTDDERNQSSLADYMVKLVDQTSHQKTWVGRYDWMILPASIRTLIGPKTDIPSGVSVDRANAAIQRWYGEYSLPADVYTVPKGTNLESLARQNQLDEKASVFLKEGYIVVNFNIETLRDGNTEAPHLQYIYAPLMNQWQMEGFNNSPVDSKGRTWPLKDGDVVFYHADQSSRSDFQSQVPH
ncbi:Ig-like protein group 2 [Paenibacillus pabuli]|uniref:Ig-like protein group 2 n=3 Tax=Paenibacillus TaxID=44249 RepID=A0A855XYA6_9BACL|nr:Ig-like protein group 2 [Paenibacillus pabuli]PXW12018.1 Ig-like protein group 2 [Paenibacillus taichungensis]